MLSWISFNRNGITTFFDKHKMIECSRNGVKFIKKEAAYVLLGQLGGV